jgi:hypothetical protein
MNKETISLRLQELMIKRAAHKIEVGKNDFPAYPMLGKIAVSLVVGIGEASDEFYDAVNRTIVAGYSSQIYAVSRDVGNGYTDGRNRIRADLAPIEVRDGEKLRIRAISPRTQTI